MQQQTLAAPAHVEGSAQAGVGLYFKMDTLGR